MRYTGYIPVIDINGTTQSPDWVVVSLPVAIFGVPQIYKLYAVRNDTSKHVSLAEVYNYNGNFWVGDAPKLYGN